MKKNEFLYFIYYPLTIVGIGYAKPFAWSIQHFCFGNFIYNKGSSNNPKLCVTLYR